VATKKLSKRELKQPDQFVGFWQIASAQLAQFAARNAKVLVVGISAIATVSVGIVVMSYVAEGRAARASAALDRVNRIENAELAPAGSPMKTDGIPRFPTEKERAEGALAALDGHWSSSRVPLSDEASLVRGSLFLDLGRADEAQALYEKLLNDRLEPRLRFLAREGLGYAFERKGKLPEAQATFAKLGTDATSLGDFYKDRARYHEARMAELQGNPAQATKIYHEVLEKSPTTSLREEISNRLALLELK
jgi:hypothetical protein